MSYKVKNSSRPKGNKIAWLGWLIAVLALLYFLSPWLGKFFLALSQGANESAYYEVLSQALSNQEVLQLPTHIPLSSHTPRPTYTQLPTHTPLPSHTPRPTYTPLPSLTPRPTYTPLPTHTPRPTYTPFPTATSTPSPTHTPTPTPIPPAFIIQQMESQAKLVVVENEITRRNFHVGVNDGLCSHGGNFNAEGVVEAGIDFDEIGASSLTYNPFSQTYTLKLPAPELTSCRIEYIRLIKNSFSICNPDWDQARTLAEVQVMKEFVDESIEDGLLDDAQDYTEIVLGEFVRNITGKPVQVIFEKQSRVPKRDNSCKPYATGGWRYNRYDKVWKK